jgi:hypothetical protein
MIKEVTIDNIDQVVDQKLRTGKWPWEAKGWAHSYTKAQQTAVIVFVAKMDEFRAEHPELSRRLTHDEVAELYRKERYDTSES